MYIIYIILYIYIYLKYICSWMDLQGLCTNFGTSVDRLELNSNFSSTKLQHGGKTKESAVSCTQVSQMGKLSLSIANEFIDFIRGFRGCLV